MELLKLDFTVRDPSVPDWAHAEHLESSMPQDELWKFSTRVHKTRRIFGTAGRSVCKQK